MARFRYRVHSTVDNNPRQAVTLVVTKVLSTQYVKYLSRPQPRRDAGSKGLAQHRVKATPLTMIPIGRMSFHQIT